MEIIKTLLWVIQIISAIAIIVLVLLQQGKGADAGATFGSGGSSSLFGASGSANFLSRSTSVCAAVFFIVTLALVIFSSQGRVGDLGVMSNMNQVSSKHPASGAKSVPASVPVKKESGNQIPD